MRFERICSDICFKLLKYRIQTEIRSVNIDKVFYPPRLFKFRHFGNLFTKGIEFGKELWLAEVKCLAQVRPRKELYHFQVCSVVKLDLFAGIRRMNHIQLSERGDRLLFIINYI